MLRTRSRPDTGSPRRRRPGPGQRRLSATHTAMTCQRSFDDDAASRPQDSSCAATMTRLLDVLEYDRVDVLGVSFGGVLAQQLACQAPDRVRRIAGRIYGGAARTDPDAMLHGSLARFTN